MAEEVRVDNPRRMFGFGKKKKEPEVEIPIPTPPKQAEQKQEEQKEEEISVKDVMMQYYKEIDELRLNYIKLMGYLEGRGLM